MIAMNEPERPSGLHRWLLVCGAVLMGCLVIIVLYITLTVASLGWRDFGHTEATPTPSLQLSEPVIDTSAIVVSGNTVTIHWEPVEDADWYTLTYTWYEFPPDGGFVSRREGTADTHYTVEGLIAGVEYTFHVFAHGDRSRYRAGSSEEVKVKVPSDDSTDEEGEEESHE